MAQSDKAARFTWLTCGLDQHLNPRHWSPVTIKWGKFRTSLFSSWPSLYPIFRMPYHLYESVCTDQQLRKALNCIAFAWIYLNSLFKKKPYGPTDGQSLLQSCFSQIWKTTINFLQKDKIRHHTLRCIQMLVLNWSTESGPGPEVCKYINCDILSCYTIQRGWTLTSDR